MDKKHVLVIRLSAMGDVAMTVPVLRELVNKHPNVQITVLSKPFLKPVFNNLKNVTFFAAEVNGKHKGLLGIYRLFKELKNLKIDAVADLHNVLRSKVLRTFFALAGKKVAFVNKGRKEKRALTATKNKVFKQLKTTHQRYADVFNLLGFSVSLENPTFPEKQPLTAEITAVTGEKKSTWIGIAPFAQYSSKMYPIDLMEQVVEQLSKNKNLKVLLFGGGKKEAVILESIASKYESTLNITGKLKLEQELVLISNLDKMLSMDSGNAHFSAMFGISTFTIWGITHPFTGFAPFNQPFSNAILPNLKKYPNIPCSIYGNKVCEGYEDVMRSILPETIVHKITDS